MCNLRVLLVYPNLQMVNLLPSNIAILSAMLKRAGHEVKLFDTTFYRLQDKSVDDIRVENMQLRPFCLQEKGIDYKDTDLLEDFKNAIAEYRPQVVGVSVVDDTVELGMSLLQMIDNPVIHRIVGGIYPTFSPLDVLNKPYVDSVCVGEGEEAFVELCDCIAAGDDFTKIHNIWTKKGDKIFKSELRAPLDLNKLPFEDFSIFEEKRIFRPMQGKIHRMVPVMIDRGCPYSCSFCAAPLLRKLYKGPRGERYFRVKTVDRIMKELEHFVQRYGADYIYFNSETFFARNDDDIQKFSRQYISRIGLPFWCQTRIETITEHRMQILRDMNCDRISIGLEHGNEEFRDRLLQKKFTNDQVIRAFQIMEKTGITVTVNNIIGFPDETRELVFDTIRLNRQFKADSINAYFFVPYSGTPLRKYCIEKGYISEDVKTDSIMRRSVLNMPQFPATEIEGLVKTFPLYVKMPESYYSKIKIAEKSDEEGYKAYAELREIFYREYFTTR